MDKKTQTSKKLSGTAIMLSQYGENGEKTVNLPSGKVATIFPGKGIHSRKALQEADGDGSLYLANFMAQLVEIDGKKIVVEDLDELTASDYMKIQTEFSQINF